MNQLSPLRLTKHSLLLVPCSGAKRAGGTRSRGPSILATLTPKTAMELTAARTALRNEARVDELALMPAFQRYSGQLYEAGASAIGGALAQGLPVAILSGGYGVCQAWRAAPGRRCQPGGESRPGSDLEVKVLWGPW